MFLSSYAGGSTARLPSWSVFLLCVIAGVCEEGDPSDANPPLPIGPLATIAVTPAEVREWDSDAGVRVTVRVSAAPDNPLTVSIATSGDAVAGGDYDLEDSELTIAAGATSVTTMIWPLRDFEEEGPESAELRISAVSDPDAAIGTPASANFTILDKGPFPNPKASLAPDLIALAGGITVEAGRIRLHPSVYNWGAARTIPTSILVAINDRPDWSRGSLWFGRDFVPAIDARSGVEFRFEVPLSSLSPGRDYYAVIQVDEIPAERPGRSWTNQDFIGFSLNAAGQVVFRCRPPATNRANPGVADPLAAEQWHLVNTRQRAYARTAGTPGEDLGMAAALTSGPTGLGVKLAVADTGLEICHPDLAANIEPNASHNFNVGSWSGAHSTDPFEPTTLGGHGTSVAGVAAAVADNGIGGRGVAPDALLRGYNILEAADWVAAFADALGGSGANPDSTDVDVFNLSLGSFGDERNPNPSLHVSLLRNGVRNLRQGRGAIYVKAAGNGFGACRSLHRSANDQIGCESANGDALNNLPYAVVVGGFNAAGRRASYASVGANLWITAPSGQYGSATPAIITTDQMGTGRGYDALVGRGLARNASLNPDGDYISTFNGTSAATPNAAGAIALLLEAQPQLSWRDVKHILAKTARQIDPDIKAVRYGFGGAGYTLQLPWITNAAGYSFHNWYGFGAVNVDAALAMAASHRPGSLGEFTETQAFGSASPAPIPDNHGGGLVAAMEVGGLPANASIEAVTLEINVTHPFTNDLGIHLISPSGTESVLNPAFNEALAGNADLDWQLLSNAFYGESPNGEWRLKIVDAAPGDVGRLNNWRLRFALGSHP